MGAKSSAMLQWAIANSPKMLWVLCAMGPTQKISLIFDCMDVLSIKD
jgi:hypothetical protein